MSKYAAAFLVAGLLAATLAKAIISVDGSTSLTQVGNNYFLYNQSWVGPELSYYGKPVFAGEFGARLPIAAVKTPTGYDVAFKGPLTTGAPVLYSVWSVDNSGAFVARLVSGVAGTDPALEQLEVTFNLDLNGDGVVGIPTSPPPPPPPPPPPSGLYGFNHVVIVVLENEDGAVAMQNSDLAAFAHTGAYLSNYWAITHPSYPNYLALAFGTTFGVTSDAQAYFNAPSLANLLDAKKLTWKNYVVGGLPENCPPDTSWPTTTYDYVWEAELSSDYVRANAAYCASHVVNYTQLAIDLANNALPNYVFISPGFLDSGHKTGTAYAANWFKTTIEPLFTNPNFMNNTLVVLTFDESGPSQPNNVYAVLYGSMVKPGVTSNENLTHYSLLRMVEDNFGLGGLGQNDRSAPQITGIWKNGK